MAVLVAGIAALILATPRARAQPAPTSPASYERLLRKQVRRVTRSISRLRRLRPRRQVQLELVTKEQLAARLAQQRVQALSDEELETERLVWARLGLLSGQVKDYKALLQRLRPGRATVFYDARARRLVVARGALPAKRDPVLAHELCRALQDQRGRLRRLMRRVKESRDRLLARLALLEGDCTAVMLEYMLAPSSRDLSSLSRDVGPLIRKAITGDDGARLAAAPALVREMLLFPHVHGVGFIRKLRQRHQWSLVDKLYNRPPASTEQVLHYRKYWRRERPVTIRARALPALEQLKPLRRDTLGELILRIYLAQGVSEDAAARAAAGWGGDRLEAYATAPGKPLLLVHMTTWDSAADAVEFSAAQRHVLRQRKLKPAAGGGQRLWLYQQQDGLQWSVQRHQKHVLVLGGAAPELRQKLQQEVWQRWIIGGRRVTPK